IWRLNRGGHDPHKVYAAYYEAMHHKGQPTVILAKTVKGYGMGEAGEGQNKTHSQKKMDVDALMAMRDRFHVPISDEQVANAEYVTLPDDSPEMQYMQERRKALGGYLPQRKNFAAPLQVPPLSYFQQLLEASGERESSTTMTFVRILTLLCRDKKIGKNIVPIVPDEARTFGMEGMFRQLGIYSSQGQLYEPQDADQIMFYKEDKSGQILEEGITEAGAMSSWTAAASAYSTHGINMVPFFIYYSMFGFQRIGDLIWAAGDMQARGFLIGATAGRTTLAGEGLQHQDGHSLLQAATIPNCVAYDPSFSYELTVIIHHGMKRMVQDQDNVFFYITTMNENYPQPAMPEGVEQGILKGMYSFVTDSSKSKTRVQLIGSGTILREVIAASELLKSDWKVSADIWSAPGINQLRREGLDCERWNLLHPKKKPRVPYVTELLNKTSGPVIAATDYMRTYADQIRQFIPRPYYVLGTDGFGRSDTRQNLRRFFEVDRYYITITALRALVDEGQLETDVVSKAIKKYGIDPEKINPVLA
ncbi:MAG: pyruvate dehydrogenase (acetyl-transferring), homodimeric type, partial [Pseudomonadota bacterium]